MCAGVAQVDNLGHILTQGVIFVGKNFAQTVFEGQGAISLVLVVNRVLTLGLEEVRLQHQLPSRAKENRAALRVIPNGWSVV